MSKPLNIMFLQGEDILIDRLPEYRKQLEDKPPGYYPEPLSFPMTLQEAENMRYA